MVALDADQATFVFVQAVCDPVSTLYLTLA